MLRKRRNEEKYKNNLIILLGEFNFNMLLNQKFKEYFSEFEDLYENREKLKYSLLSRTTKEIYFEFKKNPTTFFKKCNILN